jgi:ATP-binding cassette subfamily B protein
VTVVAGGIPLLLDIHLEIASGEHVGIVGASGAGKSSLLGLLLGWLGATEGSVSIDGRSLDAERLRELRNETAWVDPAIQLWEQSLLDNLAYGDDERIDETLPPALSGADLLEVLERQPEGLQSNVGEGGARLSGGQGQRVRLGRAFMRRQPRLVLLDEPFRGLERERRRELLRRARQHWQKATLLLVSHDVDDTNELDRVVVIEGGRVVEVGDPRALLQNPESRYASLSQRARALRQELWSAAEWRKLSVVGGRVSPTDSAPTSPAGARDA